MLEVKGFRGFRFASTRVDALEDVIAPPYDVISPEERAELAGRSPYNMVHAILPQEEGDRDRYQVAGSHVEDWMKAGVLAQDDAESLYLLEQEYVSPTGQKHTRRGFLAVAKLPETGEKTVLAHELTFSKTVDERIRLTEATRANLSPVFVVYSDPENHIAALFDQAAAGPCTAEVTTIDGVKNRVWRVDYTPEMTAFFAEKHLYIADGHHRFKTACAYRDRMREQEKPDGLRHYDYVLMGFVSLSDPGLNIFPTHRLFPHREGFDAQAFLKDVEEWFDVEPVEDDLNAALNAQQGCAFGLAMPGNQHYLLKLRDVDRADLLGTEHGPSWRDLDVAVLHEVIIERVLGHESETEFVYEKDARKALAVIEEGGFDLALLLNATRPEQVQACAEAGEAMPHKSTYFFPKLPSGLAIHSLK